MKYKGFDIRPHYSMCADWDLDENDQVVGRTPKEEDVEWYDIFDPMRNDERWISCDTIEECKVCIDRYLLKVDMKDNTQSSWDAIGN